MVIPVVENIETGTSVNLELALWSFGKVPLPPPWRHCEKDQSGTLATTIPRSNRCDIELPCRFAADGARLLLPSDSILRISLWQASCHTYGRREHCSCGVAGVLESGDVPPARRDAARYLV